MQTDTPCFRDPDQPLEVRVQDLLRRLTPEEKISQMRHDAPAIERLDIPAYNWWNECLHGVGRAGRASVFPQAIGMAASFDAELMLDVASAISDEARAKYHEAVRLGHRDWYFGLTFWSPNINLFRDPRWGRGQETYGEDPFLTGTMGTAFIRGLQGTHPVYRKVDATAKHYAVHSGPENQRHHFDARVGQRDLRESYLRAFEMCVKEGEVASVMGAYNRTNGEACCASPTLLQRILREEWGFEGYVVSDCGAISDIYRHHGLAEDASEAAALAVKAGCDLNCGQTYDALVRAVDRGLLEEDDLDRALFRLFAARFRLGMFDPDADNPHARIGPEVVDCEAHRRLARRMAVESMVLLKNEGGILPLSRTLRSLAVVGPGAMDPGILWGNYNGFSGALITPFEGMVGAVSAGTRVTYAKGCDAGGDRPIREGEVNRAVAGAEVVVAVLGFTPSQEGEEGDAADSDGGGDRRRIALPGRQLELLQALHATGKPVVLVVCGGSPVDLNWAHEHVPGILMMWYPGEEGGHALADILFGQESPSGRLPITFIKSLDQLPPFEDYAMAGRTYRFMEAEPLYPFGYGLSYTRFEISELTLSSETIAVNEEVCVQATVTNVGDVAGADVVQLYVSDLEASVPVPRLHLEGIRRVELEPGQSEQLVFRLGPEALCCYDEAGKPFVEPGAFRISVGGRPPDICPHLPSSSGLAHVVLRVD